MINLLWWRQQVDVWSLYEEYYWLSMTCKRYDDALSTLETAVKFTDTSRIPAIVSLYVKAKRNADMLAVDRLVTSLGCVSDIEIYQWRH